MLDPITNYLTSYLTPKLLDTAFIGIKNAIKRINGSKNLIKIKKLQQDNFIELIDTQLRETYSWASNISFHGASPYNLKDRFININLSLTPKRDRIKEIDSKTDIFSFNQLLEITDKNIILLGDPGAGKTTIAKKIFLEAIEKNHEIYRTFNIPIVIRLKNLDTNFKHPELILFNEILTSLGVFYELKDIKGYSDSNKILVHIFKEFIERLDALIILDGFDEIPSDETREAVIKNINTMSHSLMNSRFILTSRSADYNVHIEKSEVFEICPLNESQINEFITKWLNNPRKSKIFKEKLNSSPYKDTIMRPLLLAQMCALYEKHNDIPDKPKSVYDKIISLLLEEWSLQNSVKRISKYGNFEVERKKEFLSNFAYNLTIYHEKHWFNKEILSSIYNDICRDYNLPMNKGTKIINEIESHNGLIVQSGLNKFEFSHKSLAEYLVANYLVKMPMPINDKNVLLKIPNEIAIAISISSGPGFTLYFYIFQILKNSIFKGAFLKVFLSRLIVENPDFERINPSFALILIYISDLISQKSLVLYERIKEYVEDTTAYYNQCLKLVHELSRHPSYKNSFKELSKHYKIDFQNIGLTNEREFKNWGNVYKMTKISSFSYHGNNIEMPRELYLSEKMYSQKRNLNSR